MPMAIHERRFPLSPFYDEAAFRVGPDGTFIVRKHTYSNAMKFQLAERMSQQEMDRLGSDSHAKKRPVINSDSHGCPSILDLDAMKLYFSHQASFDLDDPGMRIPRLAFSPLLCRILRHRLGVGQAHSEHSDDVGIRSQGEAGVGITRRSRPQPYPRTLQNGHPSNPTSNQSPRILGKTWWIAMTGLGAFRAVSHCLFTSSVRKPPR